MEISAELINELKMRAEQALDNSYAPYSKFKVVASILLSNGNIITGNNYENASYSLTICAERSALFTARSQYPHLSVIALYIKAYNSELNKFVPCSPCGACRQVLLEAQSLYNQPIKVYFDDAIGQTIGVTASDLLPYSFDSNSLK